MTASTVLNRSRSNTRVSEETRRRVLQAAETLNYRPNALARGLARQRSESIGILFGRDTFDTIILGNPYTAMILQGIVAAAAETDFSVTLYTKPWINAEESASRFRDGRTDGVVAVAPSLESDVVPGLVAQQVPVVAISFPADEFGVPYVDVDDSEIGRIAARHLLELGHRRIAHLVGQEGALSAQRRCDSFCAEMARAGAPVPDGYIVPCGYFRENGQTAARHLLTLPKPPTAIFAGNDLTAFGVLDVAQELGISVPERLSVIGVDDIPMAAQSNPPLTTVGQPVAQIGMTATHLLIQRIEGKALAPKPHLLAPYLIVRGTTGPL